MKIGTKCRMVGCYEAKIDPVRIWIARSNPWKLGHGEEIVLLEGKSGGFATRFLKIIKEEDKP